LLLVIVCLASLPGCMVVQVSATNPVRGLSTVAVVPFFNQSDERAADGRLIASLYASELQKTPGLEVIPVGVVETTMREHGLEDLSGSREAAQLALLLGADAVVIGTVTEYSPYYPPRIGMSVAWYSPYGRQFDPGVPVDPDARRRIHRDLRERRRAKFEYHKDRVIGQIERKLDAFFLSEPEISGPVLPTETIPMIPEQRKTSPIRPSPSSGRQDSPPPSADRFRPPIIIRGQSSDRSRGAFTSTEAGTTRSAGRPAGAAKRLNLPQRPIKPLMTYTKIFDASDAATTAAFRDFLELRDDGRGGDWTARLQWSDEFSRFAVHMMIVEMFQLHGGEARRRVVLKWRKHK